MAGDLCGVVEKKRRREGAGGEAERVRTSVRRGNELTSFWGAVGTCAVAAAAGRRRRKEARAANGSCSRQSSIGAQGSAGARRTGGDMLSSSTQAQYQGRRASDEDVPGRYLGMGCYTKMGRLIARLSCAGKRALAKCRFHVQIGRGRMCAWCVHAQRNLSTSVRSHRSRCHDGTSRLSSRDACASVQVMTQRLDSRWPCMRPLHPCRLVVSSPPPNATAPIVLALPPHSVPARHSLPARSLPVDLRPTCKRRRSRQAAVC